MSVINGDLSVTGNFNAGGLYLPASSVGDTQVAAGAAIQSSKLQQQRVRSIADKTTVTATSYQQIVAIIVGATGTLQQVSATEKVANIGGATVTVDLLKNGTTILTAVLTRSSADTAMVAEAVTAFTSVALVQGDVLEIKFVATTGGGTLATGMFAQVKYLEDAS